MHDFMIGAAVGLSQVIAGHPLDTVKTLIQNKQSFRDLKFRQYFRGFPYPMVRSVVTNAIIFPSYLYFKEQTDSSFLAGLGAGIISSPVMFPFDIGKIKRQTGQQIKIGDFVKTPGFFSTLVRESMAMTLYFGIYNYLKEKEYNAFIAGGAGGLANWTATYPIDVIKTRQISRKISIKEAIKMGNFWRGYPACAFRAILVNGFSFWVFDKLQDKDRD